MNPAAKPVLLEKQVACWSLALAAALVVAFVAVMLVAAPQANALALSTDILGGIEVARQDEIAASTVLVGLLTPGGMLTCTGSILAPDLVVTAGHCVAPLPNVVLVLFTRDLGQTAERTVAVSRYRRHEGFYANLRLRHDDHDQNDIALLRFEGGLPPGYAPARVLDDSEADAIHDGAEVTLAGFGRSVGDVGRLAQGEPDGSGVLRKVQTTIRTARYGRTEVLVEQSAGKGACHGDSGGPAFVRGRDGALKLFGVTSRGPASDPDTCADAGIYTSLLAQHAFIEDATSEMRD
jgi:secreted trypsin-like serine protease